VYAGFGGAEETLWPGQRIEVLARLGRAVGLRGLGTADRRFQVLARGASLVASANADDVRVLAEQTSLWKVAMQWHQWAVRRIAEQGGSASGRGIVAAVATGDRELMSDSLLGAVRAAGLAHLLAVSGMHIAAVVALVYFLVLPLWSLSPWREWVEPKAVASGLALLGAICFTALTGAHPSTCRALGVAVLVLLGQCLDRRIRLLEALAWVSSALLLWRPALLWDVSFQMSFAATIALALAFSGDSSELQFESPGRAVRLSKGILSLARASFWATFATAPIALYHFGEVSPLGLFTNVLAVPLVTLILLPAALLGIVLSFVWGPLGGLVLGFSITLGGWIGHACMALETLTPTGGWPPLNGWEFALWGAIAVLLLWERLSLLVPWRLPPRTRGLLLLLALVLLTVSRSSGPDSMDVVRVTFVEIGQGDASVIELPGGQVWLVDGGGRPFVAPDGAGNPQTRAEAPARQALLPYLRSRRIDHIDLAIVSHPHPDHYVGLQAVARQLPVRELWTVHRERLHRGPYERWIDDLRLGGTLVRSPPIGLARAAGGASLEVLWPLYAEPGGDIPRRPSRADPILSVNDNSLVVRLNTAGRAVLFAGDIEAEAEEYLIAQYGDALRADVLKVPHHGSRTSSTERFARAISPAVAIISCGRANRFDFPAPEVEERWTQHSHQVLRTDEVGSVTIEISKGGTMHVSTVDPF